MDRVAAIEQDAGDTFLIRAEPRGGCDVLFPEGVDLFRTFQRGNWCRLHLNRSASDPLICCTIKLQKFRPLNALISAPAEAIGPAIHAGKGRRAAR
jgi:hypothetical protein